MESKNVTFACILWLTGSWRFSEVLGASRNGQHLGCVPAGVDLKTIKKPASENWLACSSEGLEVA
ncbi:hypothetical protein [Comamonas terrigena]|uniref:hypothetical protein n=1 Tax=Comamonas terrigena TaxID=32013 RepID=UPI0023578AD1|nr:hypothetical protein [Comamonas terrigena]